MRVAMMASLAPTIMEGQLEKACFQSCMIDFQMNIKGVLNGIEYII